MVSPVDKVMKLRLNIDVEFQGWVLLFATLTAVWVYCLPCYCSGLRYNSARKFASWMQMRLPCFFVAATFFNAGMMFLILTWLPDWSYADYVKAVLSLVVFFAKNALKFITSIVLIVAFCFVVAFKDRFLKMMGLDHKTLFRFKFRDLCGSPTVRAIEVVIWKVEDLPSASVLGANNVFAEVHMGYNEPMKTRVHNNAGSSCIFKETLQLNFDPDEEEEPLFFFLKNQKVMGSSELARLELSPSKVAEIETDCLKNVGGSGGAFRYAEEHFVMQKLIPRGQIWLRITPVDENDYQSMKECC